jgi:Flp pilus assembly protein TadG
MRGDQGVALVEFAILLPFIAVFVFGLVDLTRAYSLKNRMKNSAREAAAFVQTRPLQQTNPSGNDPCDDPENGRWHALNELGAAGESAGAKSYTISFSPTTACNVSPVNGSLDPGLDPPNTITVTVEADFDLITPLVGGLVGDPIELSESVEVVIQG